MKQTSEYTSNWTCRKCGIEINPKAPSLCYECMFTKEVLAMPDGNEIYNSTNPRADVARGHRDEPGFTSAPTEDQKKSPPGSDVHSTHRWLFFSALELDDASKTISKNTQEFR